MLGRLLEQIEETLGEQGQGRREGSVNIIVGNSGTVIIGDANSPKPNDDADSQKKTALEIAPTIQREMRRLRHQVRSLKRFVTRVYRQRTRKSFKRPVNPVTVCLASTGTFANKPSLVANHRPPSPCRQNRATPAYSLVPARINPPQPTLTRLFQSFCPLTLGARA